MARAYGDLGSRKYLLASLDQSLRRMDLDYVDIFYSHRLDRDTLADPPTQLLDTAVRSGGALSEAQLTEANLTKVRAAARAIPGAAGFGVGLKGSEDDQSRDRSLERGAVGG